MSLDYIRLSQQAKDQLIALKRKTGIKNWNVLCRWALCTSLAEESDPPDADIPADSTVEMSWKIFGGAYGDVYLALMRDRVHRSGLAMMNDVIEKQFRLHLHRGIGYLFANRAIQSIDSFVERALP